MAHDAADRTLRGRRRDGRGGPYQRAAGEGAAVTATGGKLARLCVFCGANPGSNPRYAQSARRIGSLLAAQGIALVFGGGRAGMMGALAEAALAAGGHVIGVIPQALLRKESAFTGFELSEQRVVRSMHERKQIMADLSDGFMALPGGYGTLEEICEMITWSQLGIHRKPCALLNIDGYYDGLLTLLDRAVADGMIRTAYRPLVLSDADPERLLQAMADWAPPQGDIALDWKSR